MKAKLPWRIKSFVFLMHGFTTLSVRMWWFGIGMFLIEVTPNSLQLTALYGFSNGGALLLLGVVVGDWIDRTARLKAARFAMISNNLSVILCCILVFVVLSFKEEIENVWENQKLLHVCFAFIVIITIISNLTNLGRTLILERDWIVEICSHDKDLIATTSATFRVIDLSTKVIAPLITGQVMTYASPIYGSLSIASWHVVSSFIEYFIINKVYRIVPNLHNKGQKEYEMVSQIHQDVSDDKDGEIVAAIKTEEITGQQTTNNMDKSKRSLTAMLFYNVIALYRGWRHFKQYDVMIAGIALAFLYFTVLGFDNITIGYAYSQGLTESVLGILFSCAAVFGIIASTSYPFIRRRIGLVRTGLLGLTCQISSLTICVISLWLPGSTFDPLFWMSPVSDETTVLNCSTIYNATSNASIHDAMVIDRTVNCTSTNIIASSGSNIPLILLFTGIMGARFGVWIADLTITQLFLESVVETERGLVNAFQSSLNKMMDMLKFVMVIFLSKPEMFGYPAMISYCFICTAWILYARYTYKTIGSPCCRQQQTTWQNNSMTQSKYVV